jgi:hypothetical protein
MGIEENIQTVEIWKRSVVLSAVIVILAVIYFSSVHPSSYTDLVLADPSSGASSETEGSIAIQYVKQSPFSIPDQRPGRQRKAAVSLRAAQRLPESNGLAQ